jgi:MacB-like periplasmic core domain
MRVGSTINVAFRALRRNKLRSVLTALGIIIGVAAVIAMIGIGNGAKAQVEAQIASLGQNIILVFSGSTTASGIRTGWGGAGTLKIEDAEAIRREVPGVTAVSEEVVSTTQVAAEIRIGSPVSMASRQIISTFANGHWPTVHHLQRKTCVVQIKSVSLAVPPRRRFMETRIPSDRSCGSRMCLSPSMEC